MGSNVLYHQFPPAAQGSVDGLLLKLRMVQFGIAGAMFIIWLSVAFGHGIIRLIWRSTLCGVFGAGLVIVVNIVTRGMEKELERIRQDMGRQRGEAFSPPLPESVEWLNGLIKLIWGVIDP